MIINAKSGLLVMQFVPILVLITLRRNIFNVHPWITIHHPGRTQLILLLPISVNRINADKFELDGSTYRRSASDAIDYESRVLVQLAEKPIFLASARRTSGFP